MSSLKTKDQVWPPFTVWMSAWGPSAKSPSTKAKQSEAFAQDNAKTLLTPVKLGVRVHVPCGLLVTQMPPTYRPLTRLLPPAMQWVVSGHETVRRFWSVPPDGLLHVLPPFVVVTMVDGSGGESPTSSATATQSEAEAHDIPVNPRGAVPVLVYCVDHP